MERQRRAGMPSRVAPRSRFTKKRLPDHFGICAAEGASLETRLGSGGGSERAGRHAQGAPEVTGEMRLVVESRKRRGICGGVPVDEQQPCAVHAPPDDVTVRAGSRTHG